VQDLDATVESEYASSPFLDYLVAAFNQAVGCNALFEAFYDQIWCIDTAGDYGLAIWGRIVGVKRVLTVAAGDYLGLTGAEDSASGDALDSGILYSGEPTTFQYEVSLDTYRMMILAKAAANICDGSAPEVNQILLSLFPGRGNCWVQDNNDMSVTYMFSFPLQPFEVSIVLNSGVLPTPCGVAANVIFP
jgi:hypothetical protein